MGSNDIMYFFIGEDSSYTYFLGKYNLVLNNLFNFTFTLFNYFNSYYKKLDAMLYRETIKSCNVVILP